MAQANTDNSTRRRDLLALTAAVANLLPSDRRHVDEKTDHGIREARQLLIEFVGGEAGA